MLVICLYLFVFILNKSINLYWTIQTKMENIRLSTLNLNLDSLINYRFDKLGLNAVVQID